MNTEDSEFERIEAEAKRRAQADDDDTQEYVAQREWQGLTKEDRFEIAEKLGLFGVAWLDLMRVIEARLKELNK